MGRIKDLSIDLDNVAREIADETCKKINAATLDVKVSYPAQYVLEEVIKILQDRV